MLAALGGAAAAWPFAVRAQQRRVPMIGALNAASHAGTTHLMAAYFEGLKSEGYVEGQNVMVEYRWADGVLDRIPEMMNQLVRLQPDVIMVFGTATRAAYNAPDMVHELCDRTDWKARVDNEGRWPPDGGANWNEALLAPAKVRVHR